MNLEQYKQALTKRKDALENHSKQSREARAPVELDQTLQGRLSRQDAMMQQEMAKATERSREQEITKIDAALKRLESGDFGYCILCDEEIAKPRLENDPAAATCINCAR